MQQKRFVSVLLVLVMLLTASASSLTVFASATEIIEEVTLSQPMSTTAQTCLAMTVGSDENDRNFTWYFNSSASGYLDIAERNGDTFPSVYESYKSTVAYSSVRSCYYHRVAVYDLEPDTQYVYRLRNGSVVSKNYYFQTDPTDAFSFVFVGDPQIGASGSSGNDGTNWNNTINTINQMFPENALLVLAGDQVELYNSESQYNDFLSPSLLPSYAMARSIGNHESYYKIDENYPKSLSLHKEHFYDPNTLVNGKSLGATDAGGDYWYTYNNVLFMHVNSNNRSIAEHEEFMKAAIAANPYAAWRVVVMHYAIFGAHYYDDSLVGDKRAAFTPVFDELDIDVVLNGHEHLYARSYMMENNSTTPKVVSSSVKSVTDPAGILYITASSSSGSKYYGFLDDSLLPHIAVKQKNLTTFTNIEVDVDSFKLTTYNVSNKAVIDTFEIVKTDPRTKPDDISLAFGKDYTTTTPNRNDGWDDDGYKLTDGKKSNPDGSKTVYSGWNSESVEVVVDLETAQPSDTYSVYAVGGNWGVKLPKDVLSLEVYGSDNKTSGYKLISSASVGDATLVGGTGKNDNTWSTYELTASVDRAVSYRYIKFVINHTPTDTLEHIWIDEVTIDYNTAPKNILVGKEYELSGCGNRTKYYGNLSDGVAASGPLDADRHTKWFGFYYNSGAAASDINAPDGIGHVIFDLGGYYNITKVKANLINKADWALVAPTAINVYVSDDGVNWGKSVGKLATQTIDDTSYWTEISGDWNAKYLKVEFVLGGTFACVNEIEAYGVAITDDDLDDDDNTGDTSDDTSSDDTSSDDTSSDDTSEEPAEPTNVLEDKEYQLSGCGNRAKYYGNLSDGVAASGPLDADRHTKWFGFYYNKSAAVSDINAPDGVGYAIFDLGDKYSISKIRTNNINRTDWGIVAPNAINVYVSDDGINWGSAVGTLAVRSDIDDVSYWTEISGEWNARFLKVEYVLGGTFACVNEIEAYGVKYVEPEQPEQPDIMLGDVNDDKVIDSLDYLIVKRACFKTYVLSNAEFARADVNGDASIDSTDYLLVKRIAFGTYVVK